MTSLYDVVTLGEVLIEVSTLEPFGHDVPATMAAHPARPFGRSG